MAKKPQESKPVEPVEPVATEEARPRQDRRPVCPDHDVQMTSYATSAMYTYYKCPEPGCRQTAKRIRPIGPLRGKYGL